MLSDNEKQLMHLINPYVVESEFVLGQLDVGSKTNEIRAFPEMIDTRDVTGAIISGDALITQKDIAPKVIDAKGGYNLSLEVNLKNLVEKVKYQFDAKIYQYPAQSTFHKPKKVMFVLMKEPIRPIILMTKLFSIFQNGKL